MDRAGDSRTWRRDHIRLAYIFTISALFDEIPIAFAM
jgi:hypothetical protein